MQKPTGKTYPPRADCAFLTPKPSGKGYICGALTELLCHTRGSCKFAMPLARKEGM